ncbi:PREDICTED: LOW QUALITY PROTEIN: glycoprotein 3-alpha-L-fucosyltransferase A-like, partial [Priapulus caudatus]|uniref:Fucosyltransferase n=1 Tax=Priapulus caudatus TaxID=37621 RepID=A0ABM1F2V9_PRICU
MAVRRREEYGAALAVLFECTGEMPVGLCRIPDYRHHKNYAQGKTGLVSCFVSHCVTDNKREHYVGKLHKFVSVDIYGGCRSQHKECRRIRGIKFQPAKDTCMIDMISHYKFYLAFENSNCREYITEKFWERPLQ